MGFLFCSFSVGVLEYIFECGWIYIFYIFLLVLYINISQVENLDSCFENIQMDSIQLVYLVSEFLEEKYFGVIQ